MLMMFATLLFWLWTLVLPDSDAQNPKRQVISLVITWPTAEFDICDRAHIWPQVDHQKSIFGLRLIFDIQYLVTGWKFENEYLSAAEFDIWKSIFGIWLDVWWLQLHLESNMSWSLMVNQRTCCLVEPNHECGRQNTEMPKYWNAKYQNTEMLALFLVHLTRSTCVKGPDHWDFQVAFTNTDSYMIVSNDSM